MYISHTCNAIFVEVGDASSSCVTLLLGYADLK